LAANVLGGFRQTRLGVRTARDGFSRIPNQVTVDDGDGRTDLVEIRLRLGGHATQRAGSLVVALIALGTVLITVGAPRLRCCPATATSRPGVANCGSLASNHV
jgi:hypothetical protein